MLQIIHRLEEGLHTMAFACEPVMASLHNILAWHEKHMSNYKTIQPSPTNTSPEDPPEYKPNVLEQQYHFLELEIRYGLLQIIEALHYMHYTARQVHRNVCPQMIIISKRGVWKLFGYEFVQDIESDDPTEMINAPLWSVKCMKIFQPCLDYLAPEVQINGQCNILSDMFSLGMVIVALFNDGKSLIDARYNPIMYMRQLDGLEDRVSAVLSRIPVALQEAVHRLLSRDPNPRPTTLLLPLIKFFYLTQSEPAVQALQFLDIIDTKTPQQKTSFYTGPLIGCMINIPRKLRWQNVWPCLQCEVRSGEILPAALHPIIWLINDSTDDEFEEIMLPTLKNVMQSAKQVPALVKFLEYLHIVLEKCSENTQRTKEPFEEMIALLVASLDHPSILVQVTAMTSMLNCTHFIDDNTLRNVVLKKVRNLMERQFGDAKIRNLILCFFEKVIARLEKNNLVENLIPTILVMRFNDSESVSRVVRLYKIMSVEKKFIISAHILAQRMIPSLAPQTINPSLTETEFTSLMEILYDMLDNIDRSQRIVRNSPRPTISEEQRAKRLQRKYSEIVTPPPFNIPNMRFDERKTSSAEEMARKMSVNVPIVEPTTSQNSVAEGLKKIGQWIFGSNNSTTSNNENNNFLRVVNVLPNRRLSDNTMITPKIRIAPSCASSPGGTPGNPAGLPTRRHSSIGPQERRGSTVNLSPPTVYQPRRSGVGSNLSVPSTSQSGVSDDRHVRVPGSVYPQSPLLNVPKNSINRRVGRPAPNASTSVPFLLTSSMQSFKSRRPSIQINGPGTQNSASGLLQQISSGVVRHLPGMSGSQRSVRSARSARSGQWSLANATAAGYNAIQQTAMAVKKCPSLNITLTR